ncbi:UNVERIFIED_CONTAM: hypothetical protein GTU68_008691, partial [Idotea baltica]|nr:hypothetical protein [Idotea baltica]
MSDRAFSTDEKLNHLIQKWLDNLAHVRRLSDNTVSAYDRDISQFTTFLAQHFGHPTSLASLAQLKAADVRAFLAHRRNEGASSVSLARAISALKGFTKFAARNGHKTSSAFELIKAPKIPKSLPKALTTLEAKAVIETTKDLEARPWVAARDTAVLALCYGAGLRIAEALAVTRADLEPRSMRVQGKGGKMRIVPIIDSVRQAIETYLNLCPFPL